MGAKSYSTPIKKRTKKKGKITVYPEKVVAELYRLGDENGWDTIGIAREAVTEAILAKRDDLVRKAPDQDEEE